MAPEGWGPNWPVYHCTVITILLYYLLLYYNNSYIIILMSGRKSLAQLFCGQDINTRTLCIYMNNIRFFKRVSEFIFIRPCAHIFNSSFLLFLQRFHLKFMGLGRFFDKKKHFLLQMD